MDPARCDSSCARTAWTASLFVVAGVIGDKENGIGAMAAAPATGNAAADDAKTV